MSENKKSNNSPQPLNDSFSGAELLKKSFTGAAQMRPETSQSSNNSSNTSNSSNSNNNNQNNNNSNNS